MGGAELIISDDRDHWPNDEDFLDFHGVTNLEIFGDGVINGQGAAWWPHKDEFRPKTIMLESCSHVTIKDITVHDCPCHCLELYADFCEIDGISIINPLNSHNTDGVDVHGTPFHIHDSFISTGDDNVAVHKSDVLVEKCRFGTGHGASIGSLGSGYYSNITFDNIEFNGTDHGARIKTDAGASAGKVSDVHYTNLRMHNVESALTISQFYQDKNGTEVKSELIIDGVYFENVTSSKGQYAGSFMCQDSTPCHHIELKNVQIEASDNDGEFQCEQAYGSASDTSPKSCLKSE